MYSSEDLERFYFQYQTDALPHGESFQSFCAKHKASYNLFQKWYKDTHKKVVSVYSILFCTFMVGYQRYTNGEYAAYSQTEKGIAGA